MQPKTKPLVLLILDGWGHQTTNENNAISQSNTPTWRHLWNNQPHTLLSASGLDVGLPNGQMGNSEVGHMTIGAGRVIYQDLMLINKAIDDGSFFSNALIVAALNKANQEKKNVHIMGLLSPGGVHSHEQQIFALIRMADEYKDIPHIYLHAFLDGRDTPPQSAEASLRNALTMCDQSGRIQIGSIVGRYYAMDRDNRLERTQIVIDMLLKNIVPFHASDALTGLNMAYDRGETDEFVQATQIVPSQIAEGDYVFFMNFRADRARQLSRALLATNPKIHLYTLTEYETQLNATVLFGRQELNNILGEILAQHNLSQLRIAETEKYAHVTFFFNGGREKEFNLEQRILIPSPKVLTYDLQPEMSAKQITDNIVSCIETKKFDVIICNFANADMVGHTGNLPAAIVAIECLDQCIKRIVDAIKNCGGELLITSDHGNAENMWDEKNQQPHTAHTTNLVPLIYVGPRHMQFKPADNHPHSLQDIAPTMLALLGIPKPEEMTGENLLL